MMNLLCDTEVAPKLGVTVFTLRSWRVRSFGPRFVKFGKSKSATVRYRPEDVEKWLSEQAVKDKGAA